MHLKSYYVRTKYVLILPLLNDILGDILVSTL